MWAPSAVLAAFSFHQNSKLGKKKLQKIKELMSIIIRLVDLKLKVVALVNGDS